MGVGIRACVCVLVYEWISWIWIHDWHGHCTLDHSSVLLLFFTLSSDAFIFAIFRHRVLLSYCVLSFYLYFACNYSYVKLLVFFIACFWMSRFEQFWKIIVSMACITQRCSQKHCCYTLSRFCCCCILSSFTWKWLWFYL